MCSASHGYKHHVLLCSFVLPIWAASSGGKNMHSVFVQHRGENGPSITFTQINYHISFQSVSGLSVIYNIQLLWGRKSHVAQIFVPEQTFSLVKAKGKGLLWKFLTLGAIPGTPYPYGTSYGIRSLCLPPQEQAVLQDSGSTQTHLICCHIARSDELPLRTLMWLTKSTWEHDDIVLHVLLPTLLTLPPQKTTKKHRLVIWQLKKKRHHQDWWWVA